jgi:competence protein ComEA
MTREQQWVVLFLSLSLFLFFFLTTPPIVSNEMPRGTADDDSPSKKPAQGEFIVEVDGSVNQRGVYAIRAGMTVGDVIEKAGGIRGGLSLPPESLFAKIEKTCRLSILPVGEGKGQVRLEPLAPKKLKVLSIPIDLNTASLEELDTLPGIGPKTAEAIVEHRLRRGEFTFPEELLQVPGIGPKKLAAILPHITVQRRP